MHTNSINTNRLNEYEQQGALLVGLRGGVSRDQIDLRIWRGGAQIRGGATRIRSKPEARTHPIRSEPENGTLSDLNTKPETRDPEPGTQSPTPGTRNPEPGNRNRKTGTMIPGLEPDTET